MFQHPTMALPRASAAHTPIASPLTSPPPGITVSPPNQPFELPSTVNVDVLFRSPQTAKDTIFKFCRDGKVEHITIEDLLRPKILKSGEASAFAEVAEIKMIVTQLLLSPTNGGGNAAALAALLNAANLDGSTSGATPTPNNNNNGLINGMNGSSRKRSANSFTVSQPSQPECPVALRPAINNCGNLSSPFLPQWPGNWQNIFSHLRTSPSLAGAAPPIQNGEAHGATETKQWGSPSSVESGALKTDSSAAGDSNIDPVGMDGSDGSSSTSSTCTQAMMSSPLYQPFTSTAEQLALAVAAVNAQNGHGFQQIGQQLDIKPMISHLAGVQNHSSHSNGHATERKPRKQISDDYVKLIRQQHDISDKTLDDFQIPVPEAIECDPEFVAVPEAQIIQQVLQAKKFEEMNAKEATTQLCKKLAEKRVFGPRLMAQTTVAGPNHSTYNNLPDEGILYIQHVCRTVLKDKLGSEEEFWDVFREAMRKLAARCRRVRHAKKTKSMKENVITLTQSDPLAFLRNGTRESQEWADAVKLRAQNALSPTAQVAEEMSPPSGSSGESQAISPPTMDIKPFDCKPFDLSPDNGQGDIKYDQSSLSNGFAQSAQ